MGVAEVVAMRFDLVRQRAEDGCGISVCVGERRGGRIGASSSRTATRPHVPDGTPRVGSIVGSAAVSALSWRSDTIVSSDPTKTAAPQRTSQRAKRAIDTTSGAIKTATVLRCLVTVVTVTAAESADLWHFRTR
jgi:hypothetical protein